MVKKNDMNLFWEGLPLDVKTRLRDLSLFSQKSIS